MSSALQNKRVLITGAGSGIGAVIADLFAKQGAVVGLQYNRSDSAATARGQKAFLLPCDFTKKDERDNLIDRFVSASGGIDILVNNAGICKTYAHFTDLDESDWDETYTVNLKTPFILSRNAYRYMQKQQWGRIVNISTVAMKYGGAASMHYYSSKAALEAVTVGLAKTGAKHNILANTIRCGVIDTGMRDRIAGYTSDQYEQRVGLIPLKRAGTPLDIGNMVLYLCGEQGDFITGETFTVAGGD